MKYSLVTATLCSMFFSFSTFAGNYFKSNVEIGSIVSFSEQRPANTATNNTIEISSSVAWGGACGSTAYIKAEDKHLISTMLTAWTAGKATDIEVDDTEIKGSKCKVTFIKMHK